MQAQSVASYMRDNDVHYMSCWVHASDDFVSRTESEVPINHVRNMYYSYEHPIGLYDMTELNALRNTGRYTAFVSADGRLADVLVVSPLPDPHPHRPTLAIIEPVYQEGARKWLESRGFTLAAKFEGSDSPELLLYVKLPAGAELFPDVEAAPADAELSLGCHTAAPLGCCGARAVYPIDYKDADDWDVHDRDVHDRLYVTVGVDLADAAYVSGMLSAGLRSLCSWKEEGRTFCVFFGFPEGSSKELELEKQA